MDWKNAFSLLQAKVVWQNAYQKWSSRRALIRLVTRAPKDPAPQWTEEQLRDETQKQFGYELRLPMRYLKVGGGHIVCILDFYRDHDTDGVNPVLICRYYDGACYHGERLAVCRDGHISPLGIGYPYSECGVNGFDHIGPADSRISDVVDAFYHGAEVLADFRKNNNI